MSINFSIKHLIFLFFLFDILLLALFFSNPNQKLPIIFNQYPEIKELQGNKMTFNELKDYFTNLAWRKGAEYAYHILSVADMPPNTDMHLMGHYVGDVLYKQQGMNGIKICTQDFRNACSHSIVVGLLLDYGEGILPDIAETCKQAPGGSGAYTMCYHGLGHGVLAYTNYDLPKAVELCQKTGDQEGTQCIGGTIMEIISGGDHDKALWSKKRKDYLMADKPFYPCMADFMPDKAKEVCIIYLNPYLWEAVGMVRGSQPTNQIFTDAMALCKNLDQPLRKSCFSGFGKEFVVLAPDRDIRKVEQMDKPQLMKVYNYCELANDEEGAKDCLTNAVGSLYWGGENDITVSINFCNYIPNPDEQSACFNELTFLVTRYIQDPIYLESFCQKLPPNYQKQCQSNTKI